MQLELLHKFNLAWWRRCVVCAEGQGQGKEDGERGLREESYAQSLGVQCSVLQHEFK